MDGVESVYVLAEVAGDGGLTGLSGEIMGLGLEISGELRHPLLAVVIGSDTAAAGESLLVMGAQKVFVADDASFARYDPEGYLAVLVELFSGSTRGILLAGNTHAAQDLIPRLAAFTGAGLVTDCVGVKGRDGAVLFAKPVFGGNAIASFRVSTPLKMATVRPRVGAVPQPVKAAGERVALDVQDVKRELGWGEQVREEKGLSIEEAPAVVSGGRGMGGPEGFDSLRDLAALLGGAVGASRPACDAGWIPSTCQVGITGRMVAPDLYIAVGLSGSSQHLSGMSESGKIVAINSDPGAYIFKVADYGAVGDWRQVLPAFTGAVRRLRER